MVILVHDDRMTERSPDKLLKCSKARLNVRFCPDCFSKMSLVLAATYGVRQSTTNKAAGCALLLAVSKLVLKPLSSGLYEGCSCPLPVYRYLLGHQASAFLLLQSRTPT